MTTAALVGCGDVSTVHVESMAALGIELVGLVDDTDQGRGRAAKLAPGTPVFASHHELLEAVRPDVVHVTTPHHQHAPVSIDLLAAGIHVLQEKPLAHTLAEAERIRDAAAASGARFGVCFQNRYNPTVQRLRELLQTDALGELRGCYASVIWDRTAGYYQSRPWRGRLAEAGGGLLINQAIHTLDLVAWLFGEPIETVGRVANFAYQGITEVEDSAMALFTHPSGIRTTFSGSLDHATARPVELEVVGSLGSARLAGDLQVSWQDGRTERTDALKGPSAGRSYWGLAHRLLIGDFHARLDDPEPFWIGADQALASMRMLTNVYDSSNLATHTTGEQHG